MKKEALKLARRATRILYEDDPDFVIGGCSDVSLVIHEVLRRFNLPSEVVYGMARKGRGPNFWHAWLLVENEIFDPVLWVQGIKTAKYFYSPDPAVQRVFGGDTCFEQETIVIIADDLAKKLSA